MSAGLPSVFFAMKKTRLGTPSIRSPPSGNTETCSVFITIGMRFCIDSVTPPSSASSVNVPSPRDICAGRANRAVALPSLSVLIATRAISASSIVTMPVMPRSANGSPVACLTSIAAAT